MSHFFCILWLEVRLIDFLKIKTNASVFASNSNAEDKAPLSLKLLSYRLRQHVFKQLLSIKSQSKCMSMHIPDYHIQNSCFHPLLCKFLRLFWGPIQYNYSYVYVQNVCPLNTP